VFKVEYLKNKMGGESKERKEANCRSIVKETDLASTGGKEADHITKK